MFIRLQWLPLESDDRYFWDEKSIKMVQSKLQVIIIWYQSVDRHPGLLTPRDLRGSRVRLFEHKMTHLNLSSFVDCYERNIYYERICVILALIPIRKVWFNPDESAWPDQPLRCISLVDCPIWVKGVTLHHHTYEILGSMSYFFNSAFVFLQSKGVVKTCWNQRP